MKKILAGALAGGLLGGALAFGADRAIASPPQPVGPPGSACVAATLTGTEGVTLTAGGKATATDGGLLLETPAVPDAVQWAKTLGSPVDLSKVTELSYRTRKLDTGAENAAALPAYRLFLENLHGANEKATVVFEPYYNLTTGDPSGTPTGNPATDYTFTWDVDAGKFWSGKEFAGMPAMGGGSYATNKTLAEILAANPNARVTGYAVGQGTYNAGTKATANEVKFKAHGVCQVTSWKKPVVVPSQSQSSSASQSPSGTPSSKPPTSPPVSPSQSFSASPSNHGTPPATSEPPVITGNVGNRLPTTGAAVPVFLGTGVALLLAGGALLVWLRRRNRAEFQA